MNGITMNKVTFISLLHYHAMPPLQVSDLLIITCTLNGFRHCLHGVPRVSIARHPNKTSVSNQHKNTMIEVSIF